MGAWAVNDLVVGGCLMAPVVGVGAVVVACQANAARSRAKPRASCLAQLQVRSRRR